MNRYYKGHNCFLLTHFFFFHVFSQICFVFFLRFFVFGCFWLRLIVFLRFFGGFDLGLDLRLLPLGVTCLLDSG